MNLTKLPHEPLTTKGLEVYTKPNVWLVSEDKERVYFATAGITITIRYFEDSDSYNDHFRDMHEIEIQHDYVNPDENPYESWKHGTYGERKLFKTIEECINYANEYLNDDLKLWEFVSGKEIPILNKTSRLESARTSFIHKSPDPDSKEETDNFWTVHLRNSSEEIKEEVRKARKVYENRKRADLKYRKKLRKAFNDTFGFDVDKCTRLRKL